MSRDFTLKVAGQMRAGILMYDFKLTPPQDEALPSKWFICRNPCWISLGRWRVSS